MIGNNLNKDHFEVLFQNAPISMAIFNGQYELIYANKHLLNEFSLSHPTEFDNIIKNKDGHLIPKLRKCFEVSKSNIEDVPTKTYNIDLLNDYTYDITVNFIEENEYIVYFEKNAEASDTDVLVDRIVWSEILDYLPVNIYIKDLKGRKVLANKAEYEFSGAESEEDILGKTDYDLYSKDVADRSTQEDAEVINNNEAMLNCESDFIDNKGDKRWVNTNKIPLTDG